MAPMAPLVNGRKHALEVAPETPLLWVLRDTLGLTGTKFGCDIGECGACTVLLDGEALRSCQVPATEATDVDKAMAGVLRRCGTYNRIRHAINRAVPGRAT